MDEGFDRAASRPRRAAWTTARRRLLASLPYWIAGANFLLGWWGWNATCPGDLADAAYKSLQLFGLNFDLDETCCQTIAVELQVARVSAFLISFGLLFWLTSNLTSSLVQAVGRLVGLRPNPVFVIGYGRVGQAIAAELRRDGRAVVAIDRNPGAVDRRTAVADGVELHAGDARDEDVESWPIRLRTASDVVIACANDDQTLAIASRLSERRRASGLPPVPSWLHLRTSGLVHRLREGVDLFGSGARRLVPPPRPFMIDEAIARDLFVRHPLAARARALGHKRVHLALYGFDRDFAGVALQQTLLNGMMPAPSLRPPLATVVTERAAFAAERWTARYPRICEVTVDGVAEPGMSPEAGGHVAGHLRFVSADPAALDWGPGTPLAEIAAARWPSCDPFEATRDATPVNLHLFCLADDRSSLAAALSLRLAMIKGAAPPAPIAVYTALGAAELPETQKDWQQRLLVAGDLARAVRYLPFLESPLDRLARRMHETYDRQGDDPYDNLTETLRVSNVRAAYHFAHKLALMGFENADPATEGFGLDRRGSALLQRMAERELRPLAILEHARWRSDRLIDGWREGPRDDEKRRRDQLVGPLFAYEDRLSKDERAKDELQVDAFEDQCFPVKDGLPRIDDAVWDGPPPVWRFVVRGAKETLELLAPRGWPPALPARPTGVDLRLRVLVPPERVWAGEGDANKRREARRAAFADFARSGPARLSLERIGCDDWHWRPDGCGPDLTCLALPPLIVGFAGPRDASRLGDPERLSDAIAEWVDAVRPDDGAAVPLVTGCAPGADRIAIDLWRRRGYGPVLEVFPFGDETAPRHDEPAEAVLPAVPPGHQALRRFASEDQPGWRGHVAVSRAILERATVLLVVLEDERAAEADQHAPHDGGTAATLAEARLRRMLVRRIDPGRLGTSGPPEAAS